MNKMENKYKEIKGIVKKRSDKGNGSNVSKEDFMNFIFDNVDEKIFDIALQKFTPKEYFIKIAIQNDPTLKDQLFDIVNKN